jgi:3-isopropylmalate dehydratase small subunit
MNGRPEIRGRAWLFGDHVDTDAIIPVRFCTTSRPEELGRHAMSGVDPRFASRIERGDFIVAGANFGCGSSRENAPLALLGAGVGAVVAHSFGRIFFRNAINVGLTIVECPAGAKECRQGDALLILPAEGVLLNETLGTRYPFASYPEALQEIVRAGGLVEYVRRRLAQRG